MRIFLTLLTCVLLAVPAGAIIHKRHHSHQRRHGFKVKNYGLAHSKGLAPRKHRALKRVDFFRDFPKVELPDSVDLRAFSLSPVQNQGQAGTCWAFSLTDTLWDQLVIIGANPGPLSQQYLVDVSSDMGYGCDGGNMDASRHLLRPQGSPAAYGYPYSDRNCGERVKASTAIASAENFIEFEASDYNIMYALAVLKAPLSTTVAAGAGSWERYSTGVYDACATANTDHMIEFVAMYRHGAAFDSNGNLPYGLATGVIKNSWAQTWGEDGYMESVLRDSRGNKCNNLAQEIGYFVVKGGVPPTPAPSPTPVPVPEKCTGFLCALRCWPWCRKN